MESVLEQPAAHLQSSIKTLDQTSLHLLPCGIHHDGKANISGFFFLVDGQYQSTPAVAYTTALSTSTTTSTTTTATAVISEQVTDGGVAISSESTTTAITTSSTTALPAASGSVPPEVSFRGRTLKGAVMTVPEGYIGTIYTSSELAGRGGVQGSNGNNHSNAKQEEDVDMDDDDQEYEAMLRGMQEERRVMKTKAQFKEWMFWGHDDMPTARTDKVVRAMQWIDIANVLHEPILC
ncbi:hypothetical protein BGZ95_003751 [Linnemannia exigua]|uniref:Uncharacterized protein n=1 Tax=Linnemannia exigua TaxID=604196 RepID=A0AAD4D5Y0_9FUNG|nr:hypothetical protein BGZ95_003751 [Linnemannia exigua]